MKARNLGKDPDERCTHCERVDTKNRYGLDGGWIVYGTERYLGRDVTVAAPCPWCEKGEQREATHYRDGYWHDAPELVARPPSQPLSRFENGLRMRLLLARFNHADADPAMGLGLPEKQRLEALKAAVMALPEADA